MADEAELCPQCGAAIHFSALQSELICPYCGTTIVNPARPPAAPAGAATDPDRTETNQILAGLLARHRQLAAHGVLAPAKVVSMQFVTQTVVVTDPTSNQGDGRLVALRVEVQPEGGPPFTAEMKALVRLSILDKFQPGLLGYVRYNPQDPTQIMFDHRQ